MLKYVIPKHPSSSSYQLSDSTLIGRGNKRDCYAHPEDPNLCIKVARYPERWQECQAQSIVEWYYTTHLKQRQVPLDHISDCHSWVQTNYAAGLVIERIRNEDGSPASTLRDALSTGRVEAAQTDRMLLELKHWLIKHAIAIADLNGANLMVKGQDGNDRLIFVDGIGSREPDWKFTLYQRHPWLARMKTKRQWKRQEGEMRCVLKERIAKRLASEG